MAQLAAPRPVTALRPHTPPPIAAPVNIRPGEKTRGVFGSWSDASAYCQANYAGLASLHSGADQAAAVQACQSTSMKNDPLNPKGCWIGMNDDYEEGGREELVLRSAARPLFDPAYAQPPPPLSRPPLLPKTPLAARALGGARREGAEQRPHTDTTAAFCVEPRRPSHFLLGRFAATL